MKFRIGDKLKCKHHIDNLYVKNKFYEIAFITVDVIQDIDYYHIKNEQYGSDVCILTSFIENELEIYFFTKNEIRKEKLKKLNEEI